MVRKLLVDYKQRLTSSQILDHPWMQDENVIRKAQRLIEVQSSETNKAAFQMKRNLPPPTQLDVSSDMPQEVKRFCSKRVRITKENGANGELNL